MQAHPQSNLAARIPSSLASPPAPSAFRGATEPAHPTPSLSESIGLAHDAGNLLAALGLYSDLLSVIGVLRPEHQHYATELQLISDRSAKLIRRLLALPAIAQAAAPSQNSLVPDLPPSRLFRHHNPRTSDLLATTPNHAAMLLSLAPVLERIAAGAASVTVACPAELPPLNFPSEIIERITVNLVRNAAEAIRLQQARSASVALSPSGQIRVNLAVVLDSLQLTVEDNGPGMPQDSVEAYMRPQPLAIGANRGFGHRIVHELATASKGQLSIRVRPGHGTVFCLEWSIPAPSPCPPCSSDVPSSSSTA